MRSILLAVLIAIVFVPPSAEGEPKPLLVYADVPLYPALAPQARVSGTVIVTVKIAAGSVVDAKVR